MMICANVAYAVEINLDQPVASTKEFETVFTRNLSTGSAGEDVMALQKILNLDLSLNLPISGNFGEQTEAGVKMLQEKYPVEILLPVGFSSGTGVVDTLTIEKLNQLAKNYSVQLSDFKYSPTNASAIKNVFTRNLELGSAGDDVLLLKNILNSDPDTAIVKQLSTGADNEFDSATKDAVKRFQEKYASEVLIPYGLYAGTGTVGPSTRQKLNELATGSFSESTSEINVTQITSASTKPLGPVQNTETQKAIPSYELMKPADTDTCPLYTWNYGSWGSCVNGVQTRTATQVKVADVSCNSVVNTSPVTSQICIQTSAVSVCTPNGAGFQSCLSSCPAMTNFNRAAHAKCVANCQAVYLACGQPVTSSSGGGIIGGIINGVGSIVGGIIKGIGSFF